MTTSRAAHWEARYASVDRLWSGHPNDWLPELAGGWEPGASLDIGCGEGADALWLAERGWRVTAVDLSTTAIARLRRPGSRPAGERGSTPRAASIEPAVADHPGESAEVTASGPA